jgi:hypothetical protein
MPPHSGIEPCFRYRRIVCPVNLPPSDRLRCPDREMQQEGHAQEIFLITVLRARTRDEEDVGS